MDAPNIVTLMPIFSEGMFMPAINRFVSAPAVLAFAVAVIPLAIALLDNRDPFIDEAMLVSNFVGAPDWGLLEPMPLFEQAAPLGYVLVAKFISRWADVGDLLVFRAFSAVALTGAALLIYRTASRMAAGWAASLVTIIAVSSPEVLFYGTAIKHYIFEYFACSLMIYVSLRLIEQAKSYDYLLFVGACIISCMFSFTASISIAFCLFGIVIKRVHSQIVWSNRVFLTQYTALLGSGLMAGLIIVGFHVIYTRPVTALQFMAYPDAYVEYFLFFHDELLANVEGVWRLALFAFQYFEPIAVSTVAKRMNIIEVIKPLLWLAFSIIMAMSVWFCYVKRIFFFASLLGLVGIVVVLNLLHVMPIGHKRHFLFMIPLAALVIVIGMVEALNRLGHAAPERWLNALRVTLVVGVCGVYGGGALLMAARLERIEKQEISPLLAHVERTSPETPVWVYWGAQPAMRVMAQPNLTQIGLLDHHSHPIGWTRKAELRRPSNQAYRSLNPEYLKDMRQTLEGYRDVWLIFSHYQWMEDSLQHYLAIAGEVVGPCTGVMATPGATTVLFRCTNGQLGSAEQRKAHSAE